jgi:tryptophan synthase alpha chain
VNRIESSFCAARDAGRRCVWPFLPAGCPDLETTAALIGEAERSGATGIEIGFPFSDSIADGPVIQEAFSRALQSGIRVTEIFETISRIRPDVGLPLMAMVSASIVYRIGLATFLDRAAGSGFDGLIIPDLSLEEAPSVAADAKARGLRLAMLVAPTTAPERQARIAAVADGFLYYVSVLGVTGERASLSEDVEAHVATLRKSAALPVLVGFGISTPEHVRDVCRFADGVIVGSAIVRRILDADRRGRPVSTLIRDAGQFIRVLCG